MNNITPFDFEGNTVRSTVIDDEPWFVGKDVCAILGHKNHNDALSLLDDDERKGVDTTDPLGKNRQTIIAINESGLYNLIFKSRKAAAKRFRKWVTSEVLPTIRKTGGYSVAESSPEYIREVKRYNDLADRFIKTQSKLFVALDQGRAQDQHTARILVRHTNLSDREIAVFCWKDESEADYVAMIRQRIELEKAELH
jgi:prophage antirepressor-like protein